MGLQCTKLARKVQQIVLPSTKLHARRRTKSTWAACAFCHVKWRRTVRRTSYRLSFFLFSCHFSDCKTTTHGRTHWHRRRKTHRQNAGRFWAGEWVNAVYLSPEIELKLKTKKNKMLSSHQCLSVAYRSAAGRVNGRRRWGFGEVESHRQTSNCTFAGQFRSIAMQHRPECAANELVEQFDQLVRAAAGALAINWIL